MSCVYLGGRGKLGLTVAMKVYPLCVPTVASSGAALTTLALCLGGLEAAKLLSSSAYVKLLKGFGSSSERKTLARSWLTRLGIPLDADIVDLKKLGCIPCGFVLHCAERQTPMLFSGRSAEENLALVDLVAALCSLMPIRLGVVSLLDAEYILPFECLASLVSPLPLFALGPAEPPLCGPTTMEYSALLMSLNDRMLTRNARKLPIFRVRGPHLLETFVSVTMDFGFVWSEGVAVALLCFIVACFLETLRTPKPSVREIHPTPFLGAPVESS